MKKPNTLHAAASVAACKLTRAVLRRTGRGGTAIPGIVGLKVSKNILAAVSQGMKRCRHRYKRQDHYLQHDRARTHIRGT